VPLGIFCNGIFDMPFHVASRANVSALGWIVVAARGLAVFVPERFWEVGARIANVAWVVWMLLTQVLSLNAVIASQDADLALVASGIAARLASIMFLSTFVVGVAARAPRRAKAAGLWPRVVALGGSFLPTLVIVMPRVEESVAINIASSVMCAIGFGLAAYAFMHLNRSCSIMPEARALVTSGPYRFVRHPAYLFEAIGIAGMFLPFEPLWAVPLYVVQLLCQVQRMKWEERVLRRAFPAYAGYAARTPRFIPLLRRAPLPAA
jgi:protein-S-isoprenylcysteine O-methyltransferase Ste14